MVYSQVQYVRFNTYGNTARKVDHTPVAPKAVLPKPRKHKRKVICIDPVSVLSIVVALCMVITMTVGLLQMFSARREVNRMEAYVRELSSQNEALSLQYADGYDIRTIEQSALALGMVPKEQVQTYSIQLTPRQTRPVTLWERIGGFLTSLFA